MDEMRIRTGGRDLPFIALRSARFALKGSRA